jgi:ribose 5-phosphate isomerase B
MKIGIANDHGGFELKNYIVKYLKEKKLTVIDYGNNKYEPLDDFPDFSFKLGEGIKSAEIDLGIVICTSGVGVCIAANKVKGVRCARLSYINEVTTARKHNQINVLALNGNINRERLIKMLDLFLTTEPSKEEKYNRRVKKLDEY